MESQTLVFQRYLVRHILQLFGAFNHPSSAHQKYHLLDRKLKFEFDGERVERQVWSGEIDSEVNRVRFMLANITDDCEEYALILQMDSLPPYVLRVSDDHHDFASFVVLVDGKWISAPMLVQAKVLTAAETIFQSVIAWSRASETDSLYRILLSFLEWENAD